MNNKPNSIRTSPHNDPIMGDVYYNTKEHELMVFDGSCWMKNEVEVHLPENYIEWDDSKIKAIILNWTWYGENALEIKEYINDIGGHIAEDVGIIDFNTIENASFFKLKFL